MAARGHVNDHQLRNVIGGLGKPVDGVMRPDGFDITITFGSDGGFLPGSRFSRFEKPPGNMLVAYSKSSVPVYARDLKAHGAMAAF